MREIAKRTAPVSTVTAASLFSSVSFAGGFADDASAFRTYRFVAPAATLSWKSRSTHRSVPSRPTTSGVTWHGTALPAESKRANGWSFRKRSFGSGTPPEIGSAVRATPADSWTVSGSSNGSAPVAVPAVKAVARRVNAIGSDQT